jgi:hypothetical protein
MKKYIGTVLFVLLCLRAVSQQTISDIISVAKEGTSDTLEMIYDLNVFDYFNLDTYDTELKKTLFKKTTDYQNYLSQLKGMKVEMLKTTYYFILENEFTNIDYDLKKGGFVIALRENEGFGTSSAQTPKSINHILFKALPTKQIPLEQGITQETLFIPLSQTDGLEVENNRDNIDLYFLFTPSGKESNTFKWYVMGNNSYAGLYNITLKNIYSNKVRIVVVNKVSGVIYFDKTYSYTASANK